MKTTNIIQKVSVAFVLFMATAMCNNAMAQRYGGSAYAHVKDDKGNSRVINVVVFANENSEQDAKSKLKSEIESIKFYSEEYDGKIWYSINQVDNSGKKYGGTATVRVKNTKTGKERQVNVDVYCREDSVPDAKFKLLQEIQRAKSSYVEEYTQGIVYDIDSCN